MLSSICLRIVLAAGLMFVCAVSSGQAQQPISLSNFDGWRAWPLIAPGAVPLDTRALSTQRTEFDFSGPTGGTDLMTIDVRTEAMLKGRPAVWVQWTSAGMAADTDGSSVLDALLLDRETFRIGFRMQGLPGLRSWVGPYGLTLHHPDRVVHIAVADDGTVTTKALDEATNAFDFAAMPYLLPFLGLETGKTFRLVNVGPRTDLKPVEVAIRVAGRSTIVDARGQPHEVWEVQLLTSTESTLVSMYVTDQAPYFFGWNYRRVADGRTLTKLEYREHVVF